MAEITIKQLLEAGVHFGHQTQRWNPKMKRFIFGERNGIYIINLEITLERIKKAQEYVRDLARSGKDILFVGTKRQAQDCIREAAEKSNMPYVNQRWLGGMLTNFDTVRKSLDRLETIDQMEKDGSFQFLTKKEVGMLRKEREKLVKNLMGIRNMKKVPGAIFVIDAKKEEIAIKEARKLKIPVVAVLDTNCDPDVVDYPMPGNDDAIRAIRLFCDITAEAAKEGRQSYLEAAPKEVEESEFLQHAKEAGIEPLESVTVPADDMIIDENIEEAIKIKPAKKASEKKKILEETSPKEKPIRK